MEEIGNLFLLTREAAGLSLKEVSEDLEIDQVILENIEDGKTGAFPDVFVLKGYVLEYAKYLGLDSEKILDEFNEYVFESTSKIPVRDIEKQIVENNKEQQSDKIYSPYTHSKTNAKNGLFIAIAIILVLAIVLGIVWSIKEIVYGEISANAIKYKN